MVPVREGFAKSDASARRIVRNRAYGQPTGKYGHVYYGRGQVQLTWIDNYGRSSADAGCDLVAYPDKMLEPVISARVLIKGLLDGRWNAKGKGITAYLPTGGPDDLKNARRTVNITDKWQLIGGYYKAFLAAIEAAGGVPKPVPIPIPKPETPDAPVDTDPAPRPDLEPRSGSGGAKPVGIGAALVVAAGALWTKWEAFTTWIGSFF